MKLYSILDARPREWTNRTFRQLPLGLRRLLVVESTTEVCETAAGKEALEVFRDQRPTLVILDLNLPGIGGLEVIARLKTDPGTRILVLSMHNDHIHVTRALQAGERDMSARTRHPTNCSKRSDA